MKVTIKDEKEGGNFGKLPMLKKNMFTGDIVLFFMKQNNVYHGAVIRSSCHAAGYQVGERDYETEWKDFTGQITLEND